MNRNYFLILGIIAAYFPTFASAHGYVQKPESRAYACQVYKNSKCGDVQYEPQSIEGPNGFPQFGPVDGTIPSAGISRFSQLNQQSPTRWMKNIMPTGVNNFTWYHTAPHVTKGYRYFITKQGWNPSLPLARTSFELSPFCTVDGKFQTPPKQVSHQCSIPKNRSGYHVILAIWDIGDTSNSFYQVIDAQIGSGTPTQPVDPEKPPVITATWNQVGTINPVEDLKPNERARTRVFDKNGENKNLETVLVIKTKEQGQRNEWPKLLAQKINNEHTSLKAGVKNSSNQIIPAPGINIIYGHKDSNILQVEVAIDKIPAQPGSYDYVYPNNISQYKAGTKVLASDKQVYQCKPHPFSGWCTISSHHYVPGTGSNWEDAWILLK
ncbi:lytic polysaccharide monooxygenase [Acinetobacter equi]|uniref:Chitin-binding protein n=1 Tax=Acinetobacter equi TaxID=1324350 RepID=A0A0N7GXR2_9GAMM|nr:lytic polysaccharide monooxygenase [Acinetobacter equi]ALH95427.1 chitin-binding protein [Acinetobacter equi]